MSQCRECFKRIPRDEATCFDCCSVLLDAGKADLRSQLAAAEATISQLQSEEHIKRAAAVILDLERRLHDTEEARRDLLCELGRLVDERR